jgi:hypothetical protein
MEMPVETSNQAAETCAARRKTMKSAQAMKGLDVMRGFRPMRAVGWLGGKIAQVRKWFKLELEIPGLLKQEVNAMYRTPPERSEWNRRPRLVPRQPAVRCERNQDEQSLRDFIL